MSYPSCGDQLEIPNQRFCQNCVSELPSFSKSFLLAQRSSVSPEDHKIHQFQQKSVKRPGSHPISKRCLGFGIVSLIIGITASNIGSTFVFDPIYFTNATVSRFGY